MNLIKNYPRSPAKKLNGLVHILRMVDKVIELGVSVIGGCCGSSPKHINLIKNQLI